LKPRWVTIVKRVLRRARGQRQRAAGEEPVDAGPAVVGGNQRPELPRLEGQSGLESLAQTDPDRLQQRLGGRGPRHAGVVGEQARRVKPCGARCATASTSVASANARSWRTSAPATNIVPAPVRTAARRLGSAASASRARSRSSSVARPIVLAGGTSMVTR